LRSLNAFHEDGFGRLLLLRCAIAGLAAVCFAVSASAVDPTRTVSQYIHESWGTERGWPGGSITAIAQTSDGYLWIGTDKGLVRFDGLNFHQFERAHPDPILIGPVQTLLVDASDNLWILLQNTQLLRYHNGNFELIRGEAENGTTAMARGRSGAVLFSSIPAGALTYSDNQFRTLSSAALLADAGRVGNGEAPEQRSPPFSWSYDMMPDRQPPLTSLVIAMAQTDDGKIWLGTERRGLFYLQDGRVSSTSHGRVDAKINCLLPLQNSELWVGTAKGVLRWDGKQLTSAGVPSSLRNLDALSILRDRDSNIWVGTSRGLFRYNPSRVSLLNSEENTGPVTSLFEDREGNIWIGSERGLEQRRDSAFVTYSLPNLKPQSMGPLYVDTGGRIWVAPIQGGLRWLKGGKSGVVTADGIANDVVYSIAGTGKDDVWVGRQQGGLTHLRYSGNSFTAKTFKHVDGLAQNRVYAVYRSRDGTVWSGTLDRGVSALENGHFTNYTTTDGLAANTISSIAESADGTMWFGTPNGVSAMSQKGWRTYTGNDGLPSEDVNCLLQDSAGILWIATAKGLAYLSDRHVHVPRGVPESLHAPIFGIEADKNGWLWIATSDHVLRVSRDKLLSGVVKAVDVREYDQADGLESTEGVKRSRSVVSDSAGRIWFSLSSGLSVVNPSQIDDNSVPALPHIEAITADNNTANLAAFVQIPPSPGRITFEYTGLSLAVPERIRFRYFLEGFDSSWSQPVAAREAVYTNLGPGSYRFRLVASNSEGLWNGPETAIALNVAPAYYQTYWFRLSCIAVSIGLLWALYRWRVHRLKSQEKRLRDVVETIPAMTFTTLSNGFCTFVNKRWIEYTGLSVEKTSGTSWQRAIYPEDLVRHSEKWRISVATGQVFEDEARFRRAADGEYRWFLVRGLPLRDQHGNIVNWYGTLTDIEDRKRAEQEREKLRELEADLAHINRVSTLGELVASISHDLAQPITVTTAHARASLKWLQRDPPDLTEVRKGTERIIEAGALASEIINRLRSLYKKTPPRRESVDVDEIIGEMVLLLRGEASQHAVSIRTDLAANLPKSTADRVQLQQVLMNLMLNGIEAMKETGGVVTVKSQLREEKQIEISVNDTGPGLPGGDADQIFDAFFTTKPQGSGMGLAISRSIVESHGGRLWVTSQNGRGATFHFTLPIEVNEAKTSGYLECFPSQMSDADTRTMKKPLRN
jgi:PAS domain S-box-containing protein